jgi:transcription antitermination factor NusG
MSVRTELGRQWYALRVRSNFETVVSTTLRAKGYEEFVPTYKERRNWTDRVKLVERPFFPGYVFCKLDLERRLPALMVPGIVSIVGVGRTPYPVSEDELDAVRAVINSKLAASPWPFLQTGQRVLIERGPLTGMEAILVEIKSSYRVVVSISLLRRSVAAEVDGSWVRPL